MSTPCLPCGQKPHRPAPCKKAPKPCSPPSSSSSSSSSSCEEKKAPPCKKPKSPPCKKPCREKKAPCKEESSSSSSSSSSHHEKAPCKERKRCEPCGDGKKVDCEKKAECAFFFIVEDNCGNKCFLLRTPEGVWFVKCKTKAGEIRCNNIYKNKIYKKDCTKFVIVKDSCGRKHKYTLLEKKEISASKTCQLNNDFLQSNVIAAILAYLEENRAGAVGSSYADLLARLQLASTAITAATPCAALPYPETRCLQPALQAYLTCLSVAPDAAARLVCESTFLTAVRT